jgi:hypothetical protein
MARTNGISQRINPKMNTRALMLVIKMLLKKVKNFE